MDKVPVSESAAISASRGSLAFVIGAMFFGYAFIQRVAPSVMTEELMAEFTVGGAALGSLSAWYFYAYASIQLPVGILTDRFGPRKLMSVAALICTVSSIGFAMSESVFLASISRAMIGASVAFCFIGTLTVATYVFLPKRFAMLAGLLQAVGMIGAILGQAPLRLFIESYGWRNANYTLAGIAIILSLLCYYIIPKRPAQLRNRKVVGGQEIWVNFKKILSNRQSWYCAGIGFGMTAIMLGFSGLWAVPWLSTVHEFSKTQAATMASMLFFGWALSSPIVGWLSDKIGHRKPILYVGVLGNLAFFSVIVLGDISDSASLSVLLFLTGMSGAAMTVGFSCIREVNTHQAGATALGFMNMCVVGAGAVIQPLIGWLLDKDWSGVALDGARVYSAAAYETAFLSLIAVNILALLCVYRLKETYCR